MHSVVVTIFFAFLCAGGKNSIRRVGADVAAKDLTCNFNRDYCVWTNDTTSGGSFLREANATNYRIIPTGCNFLVASAHAGFTGTAKLDSPQFTIMDSTVVLQVNFSYWLTSTREAKLKLVMVSMDAGVNTTDVLWDMNVPKSTEQWNATNINIKDLSHTKKFQLSFQGFTNAIDDVVALERIVVAELSAASVPSLDKLPKVTYSIEKIPDNANLCSGSMGISSSIYLSLLSLFALSVFKRF